MSRVESAITVDVPVRTAYGQWTQFESFPMFMEGVKKVVQRGDKFLDWTADVGGREKSWTAEIVDQTPFTRVAWKSISGTENAGAVLFTPAGSDRTRVAVTIDAEPDGPVETVGDALGLLERRVQGDLKRFKEFIEDRGSATGMWRGEIHGDQVLDGDARSGIRSDAVRSDEALPSEVGVGETHGGSMPGGDIRPS